MPRGHVPLRAGFVYEPLGSPTIMLATLTGSALLLVGSHRRDGNCARPHRSNVAAESLRQDQPLLSLDDEMRLRGALDEVVSDLTQIAAEPDGWWDTRKSTQVAGLGELVMYSKRVPGFDSHLHMGVATFEDTSLEELDVLTAAHEGAAKLNFDPALKSFETAFQFKASWGGPARLLRIHTRPQLMGIISAREVDSVCLDLHKLEDGRGLAGAMGLYSPRMAPHAHSSPYLEALRGAPPTQGMVRALDHISGYIFEPLGQRSGSGRGPWRVRYVLHSSAGGSVPQWAVEKGVSQAIASWFRAACKEMEKRRSGS